jgi:hypothetical protein
MHIQQPNQAAAVNAPVASWFQFVHHWRRVTGSVLEVGEASHEQNGRVLVGGEGPNLVSTE